MDLVVNDLSGSEDRSRASVTTGGDGGHVVEAREVVVRQVLP